MDIQIKPAETTYQNGILAALPHDESERLRPLLTRVRLINGQALYEPGERIEQVFFLESGFVSVVAEAADAESRTEVGLSGSETMVGLFCVLDPEATSFHRAMVQLPGTAFRMPAQVLRDCLETMPVLRLLLQRAVQAFIAQIMQTAICNSRHLLSERLPRWLLMAHDRVEGDELPLTHEFLSIMLAVRRAGVTSTLASLQASGIVQQSRGRIQICDRAALEASACDCYSRVQNFTAELAARPVTDDFRGQSSPSRLMGR